MTSDDLYDMFRGDVVDVVAPYLWSDLEVFTYMNDAYRMFCRLTGGIADFTSPVTRVPIIANNPLGKLDPSILRIMGAYLVSTNRPIKVINSTDIPLMKDNDYGLTNQMYLDMVPGPVHYMMIGAQRNIARWVQVPATNDVAQLTVYRLPANYITDGGQEFTDVDDDHHLHLLKWMRYLAYQKQDAETFDRAKSVENGQMFRTYCAEVVAEIERYKAKPRIVRYGGIGF